MMKLILLRNSILMFFLSIFYASQTYAMLCLFTQTQRPCNTLVRFSSSNTRSVITIEQIYRDVFNIGDRVCSAAYTRSGECQSEGCVRFSFTCAKNIQMQQAAQKRRDDYWHTIEIQLSSRHSFHESAVEHLKQLRSDFFELCYYEKEAILLMQKAEQVDNLEMYKKTFTLIAHKMRCIQRQVDIMHENSASAVVLSDIKARHTNAKRLASTEVPARWKMLCYNASCRDHPDEIIMYDEDTKKE